MIDDLMKFRCDNQVLKRGTDNEYIKCNKALFYYKGDIKYLNMLISIKCLRCDAIHNIGYAPEKYDYLDDE